MPQYKGFMLRNGANDCDYTKFYDVFLQDLLSDRSFATQASVPCVVYLNGEYWGPYNFQERYSDNHTDYKYGVDKDNVISYDNDELDDGNPGEEPNFIQMINLASSNYAAFCEIFDIDNFIDYWASEIYIYNEDWPHNNFRMWRTRAVEPGNPYGDTKWRYQMFDTEFSMGIYNGGGLTGQKGVDTFAKILDGENNDHNNNKLFKALLKNPDFCKKFVNTIMDLYNLNYHPDNYLPKLNNYASVYKPLMDGYFSRWGVGSSGEFNNKVNAAKSYLNDIRPAMVNTYLPKYFGGGYSGNANIGVTSANLRDVAIAAAGAPGVSVKINTITPNFSSGSWTGKYYSAVPITVTASPAPSGYEFDGWTVTGGAPASSKDQTITVTLSAGAQIAAKYKPTGSAVVPVTGISLNKTALIINRIGQTSSLTAAVSPSNATYKTVMWISDNSSVASVNNGTVTAVGAGTAIITASTIEGSKATCTVTVTGPTVFFDLAEKLKSSSIAVGNFSNWSVFNDFISGNGDVNYEIITENGVKKLQFIEYYGNCRGLDIRDDAINFRAGDVIEIKGTFTKINNKSSGIVLSLNNWNWNPLGGWGFWSQGGFEKTFTLTQEDVNSIKVNPETHGVRIKSCLIEGENWDQPFPGGLARVNLEQIKVYGYRD